MAHAFTLLESNTGAALSTFSTTALSPTPGSLVIVTASARQNTVTGTISFDISNSHAGTWSWTRLQRQGLLAGLFTATLWYARVPSGAGSGTFTITESTGKTWQQFKYTVSEVSGAGLPITNYATDENVNANVTVNFPVAPAATSATFGLIHDQGDTTGVTPGAQYTELAELIATGTHQIQYDATAPLQNFFWGNVNTQSNCCVVIEIPAGAVIYTMAADQGAAALAGQATALRRGYAMPAAQGAPALTGPPAALRFSRKLAADMGSLPFGGWPVVMRYNRKMPAAQAALALTGPATRLMRSRIMPAAQGSLALTGQAITLHRLLNMPAAQGAIVLSGPATGLRYHRRMPAVQGSLGLTGQGAVLSLTKRLTAVYGALAATGQGVIFRVVMPAGPGTVALVGITAALRAVHRLLATQGSVTVTGIGTAVPAARMNVTAGVMALSGWPVRLLRNRRLVATMGSRSINGQVADILRTRRMATIRGGVAIEGQVVSLERRRIMPASRGLIQVLGQDIVLDEPGIDMVLVVEGTITPDRDGVLQLQIFSKSPGDTVRTRSPAVGLLTDLGD